MRGKRVTPMKMAHPSGGGASSNFDSSNVKPHDKSPPLPSMGVSIAFLKIVREVVKSSIPDSELITVADVAHNCIKEWTEGSATSILEHIKRKYSLDLHPVLQASYFSEYFGEATVFVSYARKYSFDGLVDALELFERNNGPQREHAEDLDRDEDDQSVGTLSVRKEKKIFFWIDIFTLNQFLSFEENKFTLDMFTSLIGKIGETCLVCMPWSNPLPFRRTWCLFEVLATHLAGATLTVQLSKTRHPKFLKMLSDDYENAIKSLNINIDVESSECSNEHEKIIIFDVFLHMEEGYHHANSAIAGAVRHWCYLTAVRSVRHKMRLETEHRMTERVEKHRKVSLFELLCLSFGCITQPVDLTVFDPVEREIANFHVDCGNKLTLAALYNELARFDEAEALYKEALQGNLKHFGESHPATLSIYGNLAFLYKTQHRFDESEALFERVLASKESTLGPAHPSTLTTMQNLAGLYKDCHKHEQAIDMYSRSLSEQESELGESHTDTIASMEHLAHLYLDCGHNLDAKALLERLLELKINLYGERHKETATTYETTAALYVKENMLLEADELFRHALNTRELIFGPNHPSTIATVLRLACVLKTRKQLHESEELFRRVLVVTENNFGALHISCFELIEHLIDIMVMSERYEQAEVLLLELLGKKEDLLGVKSVSTLSTKFYLGEVYCKMKKYVIAETYHRTALNWRVELLGEAHRDSAASMHGLATCLVYLRELDEGKGLYERALIVFDTLDGPDNPHSVSTADCLATVCKVTGDVQQAEALLNRLKTHYRALHGPNHPITISFAKRLTALFQS